MDVLRRRGPRLAICSVQSEGDPESSGSAAMEETGDEEIVRAIARGESAALGILHDRWAPSLLAVARKILGSDREAEECVHDTLLEVWHRARHYTTLEGPVRSWLHLRLRSRALQRLR